MENFTTNAISILAINILSSIAQTIMFGLVSFVCVLTISNAARPKVINNVINNTQIKKSNLRVIDGQALADGQYPFVVLVAYVGEDVHRWCTGSMISEEWTLTAKHCITNLPTFKDFRSNLCVWYGNYTASPIETKLYSKILEYFVSSPYSPNNVKDGLSLVRSNRIYLKTFGVLSVVDQTTLIGLPVTYIGGGFTQTDKKKENTYLSLHIGEGGVIKCQNKCENLPSNGICVTPKCSRRSQNPYVGDSGGPLICDGKIVGVHCCITKVDGIVESGFIPISPHIDWILDITRRITTQ